jgi:uncharacterized protein DUF2783
MAGALETGPAADPDAIYQLLIEAHSDLTAEQSALVNSKLMLLLANHIGDPAVIAAAVAAARRGLVEPVDCASPSPEGPRL